jgi:hypothetical protein
LLALNASPGGAADLLAATLFIDRIASRGGDRRPDCSLDSNTEFGTGLSANPDFDHCPDQNAYCIPSRNPHQEAQPQWNI